MFYLYKDIMKLTLYIIKFPRALGECKTFLQGIVITGYCFYRVLSRRHVGW